MADVFISYQRDDRDAVTIIGSALTRLKLDVWFDEKLRSGSTFDSEIAGQLDAAQAVLTCWTPGAAKSQWVRSEATAALESQRLLTCFLVPTQLPPPFNLVHAEDLSSWAGQERDPAWLRLLEQIGQFTGRTGLATFDAVMRPTATLPEMKAWVTANAGDPLSAEVWNRIGLIEGEDATQKAAREAGEARAHEERRLAQARRSKDIARARGLRDPEGERRRWRALLGAVGLTVVLVTGWIGYSVDANRREARLDALEAPGEISGFAAANWFHPIHFAAQGRLRRVDDRAWANARSEGTKAAIQGYIDTFTALSGQHLAAAGAALQAANRIERVQRDLQRMGLYRGIVHGALDAGSREAIGRFRLRTGIAVSDAVDDELMARLDQAIARWVRPLPAELRARHMGPPSEDEIAALAHRLAIDIPTLLAVYQSELGNRSFDADGRPRITFEPRIFQRLTNGVHDTTHPAVSNREVPTAETYQNNRRQRWDLLAEAFALDPEAAYGATLFGAIRGSGARRLGFSSAGEFARFVSQSELSQLEAIFLYASSSTRIVTALRDKNWEDFVLVFTGGSNSSYVQRLRDAYGRNTASFAGRPPWEAASLDSIGGVRAPGP